MFETLWDQIVATSALEWVGSATGAAGVWLSIREKVWAWPTFIVCYGVYVELSRQAELHAALLMNLVFVGLSAWGWWQWARTRERGEGDADETLRPKRTPRGQLPLALAVWLVGGGILGAALATWVPGEHPYLDANATVAGFVAQWMLGKKYIETWLLWAVSDVIFIGLWGAQGYVLSALLFVVYTGLAVQGWVQWRALLGAADEATFSESTP